MYARPVQGLNTFVQSLDRIALPLVRQRIRSGLWAIVVRDSSSSLERFVRRWTVVLIAAVAAWTVLVPTLGAGALAVATPGPALSWLGIAFIAAGFAITIAAQAQMGASWRIGIDDAPTALVTHGLFRWIRHPIYTGILAMVAGITCLTPAPRTACAAVLAYVLVTIQSHLEEAHLLARHGDAFAGWANRTGRFLPGLRA